MMPNLLQNSSQKARFAHQLATQEKKNSTRPVGCTKFWSPAPTTVRCCPVQASLAMQRWNGQRWTAGQPTGTEQDANRRESNHTFRSRPSYQFHSATIKIPPRPSRIIWVSWGRGPPPESQHDDDAVRVVCLYGPLVPILHNPPCQPRVLGLGPMRPTIRTGALPERILMSWFCHHIRYRQKGWRVLLLPESHGRNFNLIQFLHLMLWPVLARALRRRVPCPVLPRRLICIQRRTVSSFSYSIANLCPGTFHNHIHTHSFCFLAFFCLREASGRPWAASHHRHYRLFAKDQRPEGWGFVPSWKLNAPNKQERWQLPYKC